MNGFLQVNISNKIIPKLNISTFSPYLLSYRTSGATYPGVPHLLN